MPKKKRQRRRGGSRAGNKSVRTVAPGTKLPELTEEEMQDALDDLKRFRNKLMRYRGVFKVDVGYKWKDGKMTGEIAIRVHVRKKESEEELASEAVVPKKVGKYPVDVIESNLELQRRTRRDPLVGGVETRNVNIGGVGTLGAVVYDRATRKHMALSNHHVYVDGRPNAAKNERANQPGTTTAADTIGKIKKSNRRYDCAVAELNCSRRRSTELLGLSKGTRGVRDPTLGMRVAKSGRTTGVTYGMVEGVSTDEFTIVPVPGQWMELSSGGDSGSVWISRSKHAAVGLHFAGEVSTAPQDERAWAKRMTRVANALTVEIVWRDFVPGFWLGMGGVV